VYGCVKQRAACPPEAEAPPRSSFFHCPAASLSAPLRYGRRGENRSPHGAGAPAVPASRLLMWCAVAPLQARQPCGPFRSVTLAGCAAADPNSAQPSGFWVRRLRPKNGCGVKENRHALAFGKRA